MSTPPTPTERKMYKIMGELKKSNDHRAILHKHINQSLDAIEALILANPTVETFKSLYLQTLSIHCREKTVLTYQSPKQVYNEETQDYEFTLNRTGDKVWESHEFSKFIGPAEWRVSIVRKGTKVRVHLTEEAMDQVRAEWDENAKHKESYRDITYYE